MVVVEKIKSHPDVAGYCKELAFHNKHIKKPKVNAQKTLICFLNFLLMEN